MMVWHRHQFVCIALHWVGYFAWKDNFPFTEEIALELCGRRATVTCEGKGKMFSERQYPLPSSLKDEETDDR